MPNGEYTLSPDEQKKISIEELASLIFEILKRHFQEDRKVHYYPSSLMSIKEFEFLRGSLVQDGVVSGVGLSIKEQEDFAKKFAEAVVTLRSKGLIISEPGQKSDDFVILSTKGEQTNYTEFSISITPADEIIAAIKSDIPNLDAVVEAYYKESIRALQEDLLLSSAFALGVSSERAIIILSEAIRDFINEETDRKQFEDAERSIKKLRNYSIERLNNIRRKYPTEKDLFKDIDSKLETYFTYYRLTRNEVGHPDQVPKLDSDVLKLYQKQFGEYLKSIFYIIDILRKGNSK